MLVTVIVSDSDFSAEFFKAINCVCDAKAVLHLSKPVSDSVLNRFRFACANIVDSLVLSRLTWQRDRSRQICQQKRLRSTTVMCLIMFLRKTTDSTIFTTRLYNNLLMEKSTCFHY